MASCCWVLWSKLVNNSQLLAEMHGSCCSSTEWGNLLIMIHVNEASRLCSPQFVSSTHKEWATRSGERSVSVDGASWVTSTMSEPADSTGNKTWIELHARTQTPVYAPSASRLKRRLDSKFSTFTFRHGTKQMRKIILILYTKTTGGFFLVSFCLNWLNWRKL